MAEPRTGKSDGRALRDDGQGVADPARRRRTSSPVESHQKAAAAYERGFFKDLVVPFRGLERDNILRADTTLEKLATLKPAFDKTSGQGTLTAGNSTPLTDGASAVPARVAKTGRGRTARKCRPISSTRRWRRSISYTAKAC